MVVRKRKRSRKQRGGTSHGWGFSKRHRGKGHKPYRGSGVGKRGAHRETIYLSKGIQPIGKHGMSVRPRRVVVPTILMNVKSIEERLDAFVKQGIAQKSGDSYSLDLTKLGFVKLLSDGQVSKKLSITCSSCSAKAKEKIVKAGGSVTVKE